MSLKSVRTIILGVALVGALTFAACGGGDDDESTPEATETMEPTATATADDGGGNGGGDGDELFGGSTVAEFYTLNCSSCHGANREGISGLGLPLVPDALTEDDEFYFNTIKNGREGTVMPAWGDTGLSDAEIEALVQFIRTEP